MAWLAAASLALLAGLLLVPQVFGVFGAYQFGLFLIYSIVGQGVALCWGRANFLPLGQALFFGLGAYLAGFALKANPDNWPMLALLLPLAAMTPGLLAYVIGRLVFDRRTDSGPYFSLITLALAMLGFQAANSWNAVTGGFNGLGGIPPLPGVDSYEYLYYVIAGVLTAVTFGLGWLMRTPLALLWSAIAQNEDRLQFLGFATNNLKALAFGLSGLLAGIAGVLLAPHQGIVTPQSMSFILSAELVVWTAVGGRRHLAGPIIGAVLIGILSSELRDKIDYWEVFVALVFIVVVLKFPNGLAGVARFLPLPGGQRRDPPPVPAPPVRFPRTPPRLSFEDVFVERHGVRILDGLDLALDKAGIHCIIGPNGAGKTSVFNTMTGRLPVTGGRVLFDGRDVTGARAYHMVHAGIGRKFQIPSIFPDLTVGENLALALWACRTGIADLVRFRTHGWGSEILDEMTRRFPFLGERRVRAGDLSQGERQVLELAMAVIGEPRLLLLDEPCAGLSLDETMQVIDAIRHVNSRLRGAILVIEHDMVLVRKLSDHVYVLHQGHRLAEGSMPEIQANPDVQAVYVGGTK